MIPGRTHLLWLERRALEVLRVGVAVYLLLVAHVLVYFPGDQVAFPVECAVVFGAAVRSQGVAGPGIERRVEAAAVLYNEGKVGRLFLTGGKGSAEQPSEAAVMQRVAMRLGVAPEDITLEDQARSTWENIEFTYPKAADCTSVIGISDRYHLARIEYLAERLGWEDFRTLPAGRVPPREFEARAVAREALGFVYYTLREYIPIEKYLRPESDFAIL